MIPELMREAAESVRASQAENGISDSRRQYRKDLEQRLLRASEKICDLPKAIFAAGFRAGYAAGQDDAVAYEWGTRRSTKLSDAWSSDVQWRLDTDGSYRLDPFDPEAWEDVP